MARININVPPEMEEYEDDLRFFFEVMIRKLFTNRHKGFSKELNLNEMLRGCLGEIDEMAEAIRKEGQFEVAVEAADAANFAFLMALTTMHMTRQEFEESRIQIGEGP